MNTHTHTQEVLELKRFHRMNPAQLQAEYLKLNKASFCGVFGGVARSSRSILANYMVGKGLREIYNPLGNIAVKP